MNIFLDIETLPTDTAEVRAEIAATVLPPKTMSRPETIAKWEAEEKPALVEEALRRTALDGTYGRVLAVGYARNNEQPHAIIGEEVFVIESFFAALKSTAQGGLMYAPDRYVGHNISAFDLRFLWQRAVIHGITVPAFFLRAVNAKAWSELIADTMHMWNPERDRRVSLKNLCRALGVPNPKAGLESSQVYDAWRRGELDRIADLVRGDVTAVRECYQRMTGASIAPRIEAAAA